MRDIKFRAWDNETEILHGWDHVRNWDFDSTTWPQFEFMQFTGLFDKNNNPIYEGDIMNYGHDNKEVVFMSGSFGVINKDNSFGSYMIHDGTIVGNIHQNPELISKNKQSV